MPDVFLERHVPHLPQRMFDLVSDLEAYPRFVPNCSAMDVREDAGGAVLAKMTVQFGPIKQAYTSRVVARWWRRWPSRPSPPSRTKSWMPSPTRRTAASADCRRGRQGARLTGK